MRKLIVLTGPSHAGKSAVAATVRHALNTATAHIAIDEIVAWFGLEADESWERWLLAAYDVALVAVDTLLRYDFTVIFESTFTFIPDGQPGEFHEAQLRRVVAVANELASPYAIVRLQAELDVLLHRHSETGRLTSAVVEGTWRQHAVPLPDDLNTYDLETSGLDVDGIAARIVAIIRGLRERSER